ncbi:HAD family hydrolase [Streptomyces tauricus]
MAAVLFDFSGTLFRIESAETWLRAVLAEAGTSLPEQELLRTVKELEAAGALPGGAPHRGPVPPELASLWGIRDESAEAHRAAYTGACRQVALPAPELYDALYDRHMDPVAWRPYADAIDVLRTLRDRGVAVGVVSNIGWDLRPVFREHGLDAYVGAYVLSYEHGVQKPDARLFATACDALGADPRETLMVGDDRQADGGAATLGCRVHFVDHLPVSDRPNGLRPVLDLIPA